MSTDRHGDNPDPLGPTRADTDDELEFKKRIKLLDTIPFERTAGRTTTEPTFDEKVLGFLRVKGPMQLSDLVPALASILGINEQEGLEARIAASPLLTVDDNGRVARLDASAECLDIDFLPPNATGLECPNVASRDEESSVTLTATLEAGEAMGDGSGEPEFPLPGYLMVTRDTSGSSQGATTPESNSDATMPLAEDALDVLRDLIDELDSPSRKLSAREIIYSRFGLDGRPRQTLQQIGDAHRVTRERIRQISAASMDALRVASAAQLSDLVARIETYARTLQIAPDSDLMRWKLKGEYPGTDEPILPWLALLREIQSDNWSHLDGAGRTSLDDLLATILQTNGPLELTELGSATADVLDIDSSSVLNARIAASPAVTIDDSGVVFQKH